MGSNGGFFWYCNLCRSGGGTRSCILTTSEISARGPKDQPCILNPNWSADWMPIKINSCPNCNEVMYPHGALRDDGKLRMGCPRCGYAEYLKAVE